MKKLLLTLLCALIYLSVNNVFAKIETEADTEPKTISYSFKAGAGRPGEIHPNGTQSHVFRHDVPCLDNDDRYDLNKWIYLGDNHFIAGLSTFEMTKTGGIFNEWVQLALFPQITKAGKLSTEETSHFHALKVFDKECADGKYHTAVAETYTVMHLFMPDEEDRIEGAGAVLGIEGSKGVRLTALHKGAAYKNKGIPYLVPDFIGTEASSSTVENQLSVSFFGRALGLLGGGEFLKGLDGVNPKKIVWDAESIGSTQALVALLPEVIEKFGADFIPPAYLALNDLAPILTSPGLEDSLFWKIPKTIWGGEKDQFTPLDQVRDFLGDHLGDEFNTLKTHSGGHDSRSLWADTLHQEEKTYLLRKAIKYEGFKAFMNMPTEDIRTLFDDLPLTADIYDIMDIMELIFGKLRLNLMTEGLDVVRDRIAITNDVEKIKTFENMIGKVPVPGGDDGETQPWKMAMALPEGHLSLDPAAVVKALGILGKGATFGPESAEKAKALQDEVIDTVLRYALPNN